MLSTGRARQGGLSPASRALMFRRLAELGIKQNELATRAGLDKSTITRLFSGSRTRPRLDTLVKLAKALEVPTAALLNAGDPGPAGPDGGTVAEPVRPSSEELQQDVERLRRFLHEPRAGLRLVGLYRWATAGDPRDGSAEPIGAYPVPPGRVSLVGARGFAVLVAGTSMVRRGIQDGDIVFVNPDLPWGIGSVVLARVLQDADEGEPRMLVKEVSLDERGRTILRGASGDGGSEPVPGTRFQVIGPVVLRVHVEEPHPRTGPAAGG